MDVVVVVVGVEEEEEVDIEVDHQCIEVEEDLVVDVVAEVVDYIGSQWEVVEEGRHL